MIHKCCVKICNGSYNAENKVNVQSSTKSRRKEEVDSHNSQEQHSRL